MLLVVDYHILFHILSVGSYAFVVTLKLAKQTEIQHEMLSSDWLDRCHNSGQLL